MLHGEELPKVLAMMLAKMILFIPDGKLIAEMPDEKLLRSIAQNKEFRLIELEAQQNLGS